MDFLSAKMFGFFLVLTRLGAFFATAPVFSWQVLSEQTKAAIAVVLALFFSALFSSPYTAADLQPLPCLILLAQEALYVCAWEWRLFASLPSYGRPDNSLNSRWD